MLCGKDGIFETRSKAMWIFGYGSLIFRPSFRFLERRRAFVRGFERRFWQGSPDHRGVPEAPGRVVTLIAIEGAVCGGCAYRIDPAEADSVLEALDMREQAGFSRHMLPLHSSAPPAHDAASLVFAEGLTWIANADNAHFLGPLPEEEIANVIRTRHGPSGANTEYVLRLRESLRELDIVDPHVEKISVYLTS